MKRRLLVVGPFPWSDLHIAPTDWAACDVVEAAGEAGAVRLMRQRSFDVLVTNPATTATEDLPIVHEAREWQPGIRVIVLAPAFTPQDVITALRAKVYACFGMPCAPDELRDTIRTALDPSADSGGIELLSAVPHWIAVRVACSRVTADRIARFMHQLSGDVPETDRYRLITAFREVLLNAMEHGAGFDPDKVVDVHAVRTKRTIVYYFKDPGPGFDPHAPGLVATDDDPLTHLAAREQAGQRAGGFGMMMATKLVDEIYYSEKGNEVILVKHLD